MTGFFMTANYLWVVNAFNQHPVLKYLFWTFCFTGILLFWAIPFLKPKKIGMLEICAEGIDFNCKENKVRITLSQIKQLDLQYGGFKRWWNRAAHGNRNYLILETTGDDYFEFEILVKSREHKNILDGMVAAQKDNQSLTSSEWKEEVYVG